MFLKETASFFFWKAKKVDFSGKKGFFL